MYYCGIDLACKASAICVTDERDHRLLETEVPTDSDGFRGAFSAYSGKCMKVVVEVSPLAEWAAREIEALGFEAIVIDARKAKALIKTKKKTDKIDARKLAKMARTGWYSEIHRKSEEARYFRTLLQARAGVGKNTRALGSRIRGLLRSHGVKVGQVSNGRFVEHIGRLIEQHDPRLHTIIGPLLDLWVAGRQQLAALTKQVKQLAKSDELMQRLMQVPGVGVLTATAFVATIDDPRRFSSGGKLAASLGMVPSIQQSGETEYRGRITKEGDALLRSYLVEAAQTLLFHARKDSDLKRWGRKLMASKGVGKARVAVARKLAVLLYRLWLTGENYRACSVEAT